MSPTSKTKSNKYNQLEPPPLFRRNTQKYKLLRAFAAEGKPMIAEEAAIAAHLSLRSCYWSRVSELRRMGLIRDTGEFRKSTLGSMCTESAIAHAGIKFLRETDK